MSANAPKIAALKKHKPTKASRQLIAMAKNYAPAHRRYAQLSWPASVPAIAVVSASTPYPAGLDARRWRDAQAKFVNAASNRRLVTAAHSSHDVPIDRPGLVVRQTREMLGRVGRPNGS